MDDDARELLKEQSRARMQRFAASFYPRLEREFRLRSLDFEAQVMGSLSREYLLPVRDHLNDEYQAKVYLALRSATPNPAKGSKHGLVAKITWKDDSFELNLRQTHEKDVMAMSPMKVVDQIILAIFNYEHRHADDFQKDADAKEIEQEVARKVLTDAERLVRSRQRAQEKRQAERDAFKALKSALPPRFSAVRQEHGFAVKVDCGGRGVLGNMSVRDMEQLGSILEVWSRGKLKPKRGASKMKLPSSG